MNTISAEITVLLEEILKESLQAGITPDFIELANSRTFREAGTITPGAGLDYSIAYSDEINDNLDKIEHYAKVLDYSAGMQADETQRHRDSFPDRIARLERWYRELAYKVDSLVMAIRTGTSSLYSITESFSSLKNIDLTRTTAYIDTEAGLATIPANADTSSLAAETGGDNVQVSSAVIYDSGLTTPMMVESLRNGVYKKYITRSINNVYMDVTLRVNQMNGEFRGGLIEFDLGFASSTKIASIKGTSDNKNFEDMAFLQNGKHVVIPVSSTYMDTSLIVKLDKTNYEGVKINDNGTIEHQFIFEISNLRLPNRRYKTSASIYSTSYDLPENLKDRGIAHLRVMTDGALATGDNRIDAFVSLDSGGWRAVSVNKSVSIGLATEQRSEHFGGTTIRELPSPVFKLEGDSPSIVMDQSRLWEGYDQAEVESIAYSENYSNISHWANYKGTPAYKNLGGQGVYLGPEKAHKIFLVMRSPVKQDLIITNVGVKSQEDPDTNQASFTTVIFNGQELRGKTLPNGDYEYLLSMLEGDNTLNILIGIAGEEGGYINIGSQLAEAKVDIFVKERAATSMQAVLALDSTDKVYCVYDGKLFLNYIPPTGAQFLQSYTLPTAGLPKEIAVRFDLVGDGTLSPTLSGFIIEFTPGSR